MSLYTTYGVQSSVPAKTVVAVITPPVEATTINYNFGTTQNNTWIDSAGQPMAYSNNFITDFILIQNNQIIADSSLGEHARIFFYTSNYSYISFLTNPSLPITIPNNAIYFRYGSYTAISTYNQFSSNHINLRYNNPPPAPQTVTFFDEYPNGTQIGDAVEVNFVPSGTGTQTNYTITHQDNVYYGPGDGGFYNSGNWSAGLKQPIIDNSVILSTNLNFWIIFWNENTFIGSYGTTSAAGTFNAIYNNVVPANATHFGLTNLKDRYSFANFQNFGTVSYLPLLPAEPVTVNPPATYKIRQLVFEE